MRQWKPRCTLQEYLAKPVVKSLRLKSPPPRKNCYFLCHSLQIANGNV